MKKKQEHNEYLDNENTPGVFGREPVNNPTSVRNEIAASQDGGTLEKSERFSNFINECIDYNTSGYSGDNSRQVNIEDLLSDFNYMIDQLKKAKQALLKEFC